MRSRAAALVLGMAAVLGLGTLSLPAQEPSKAAEKKSSPSRRVPKNFSKVGVTPEQKEKIYAIRGKYQDQVASLQKQIDDLKAKEMSECEAVLTPAQKKTLESLRGEAKAKGKSEVE